MTPPLYAGVDGGGRKTLAVVGDERGNVLGEGWAGPSNHAVVGLEAAIREVRSAVKAALAAIGGTGDAEDGREPTERRLRAAALCLSGADRPADQALLESAFARERLAARIGVWNDGFAVLRAGTADDRAIAVVAGTGINAVGRNGGRRAQLPALGALTGDWGGTTDLVRETLALAMRAHDGRGRATSLTAPLLAALRFGSMDELLEAVHARRVDAGRLGALVPLLFDAANEGDAAARAVVERLATELAVCAAAIGRRLDLGDASVPVVFGGGTVRAGGAFLAAAIRAAIARVLPAANVVLVDREPAYGAYLLALELAARAGPNDR